MGNIKVYCDNRGSGGRLTVYRESSYGFFFVFSYVFSCTESYFTKIT